MPLPTPVRLLFAALALAYAAPLYADAPPKKAGKIEAKKPEAAKFIRIKRNAQGQPTALETAIVRYVPANGEGGLAVDLVSAVHVGDRGYYDKLNDEFDNYDVVLYELVAPQGTRIPKGGRRNSDNPLAIIQTLMKLGLELDSQVERVDYTKKNFVHADLSPDGMAKAMRDRGEDPLTLILGVAADMLRRQNVADLKKDEAPAKKAREPEMDFFQMLGDPERAVKLKRIMAEQMEDLEGAGLGQTLSTLLITDRNQAAMKVFQKELAKGKKKVAIFYGAAHMPDFEKRLKEDYGLKRDGVQWLTAWEIKKKDKGLDELMELLKLLGQ